MYAGPMIPNQEFKYHLPLGPCRKEDDRESLTVHAQMKPTMHSTTMQDESLGQTLARLVSSSFRNSASRLKLFDVQSS